MLEVLRVGTRASPLALKQAQIFADQFTSIFPDTTIEFVSLKTTGDIYATQRLSAIGGKGLFTKELEEALLSQKIDVAVHSLKDMATKLPEGLCLAAVLKRDDPRDAFLSNEPYSFRDLPRYSTIGTSSLRREAFTKYWRPDIRVVPLRGNVESRLRKMAEGEADGTFLAVSGLKRISLTHCIREILEPDIMLPAVAQGCIAIQVRECDEHIRENIAKLNDHKTMVEVYCERAFLRELDGSCRTPIAALAQVEGERIALRGAIVRPDGGEIIRQDIQGSMGDYLQLGMEVAKKIQSEHGDRLRTEFRI